MFQGATSFNQNISAWDVSNVYQFVSKLQFHNNTKREQKILFLRVLHTSSDIVNNSSQDYSNVMFSL